MKVKKFKKKIKKEKKKNAFWIGLLFVIVCILGLFFGSNLDLSSSLSGSDFTMTNAEVENGYIQLVNEIKTFNNPTFGDISSLYSGSWSSSNGDTKEEASGYPFIANYGDGALGTAQEYCRLKGFDYISYSLETKLGYYDSHSGNYFWAYYDNPVFNDRFTSQVMDTITQIVCKSDLFETSGNVEQSVGISTTEKYNAFEVQYNEILNNGEIKPYLIIGEEKYYFENKVLNLDIISSDTIIKLGFDIEGSDSQTPQIENSISLIGIYSDSPIASGEASSSSVANTLAILTAKNEVSLDGNFWDNLKTNFSNSPTFIIGIVLLVLVVLAYFLGGDEKK